MRARVRRKQLDRLGGIVQLSPQARIPSAVGSVDARSLIAAAAARQPATGTVVESGQRGGGGSTAGNKCDQRAQIAGVHGGAAVTAAEEKEETKPPAITKDPEVIRAITQHYPSCVHAIAGSSFGHPLQVRC